MSDDPTICVASLFRNSSERGELDRYMEQWAAMDWDYDRLHFVAIEGDSTDDTYRWLQVWAGANHVSSEAKVTLIKHDQGTPSFGSVITDDRLKKLAELKNLALDAYDGEDYFLWVESDLILPPDLLRRFMWFRRADVQAPVVLQEGARAFYDVWAYRIGTMQINPNPNLFGPGCFAWSPPYHPSFDPVQPFRVDSAGSCLLIKRRVMETGPRFAEPEEIVTFCHQITEKGFTIWCNPHVEIHHPVR